MDGRAVAPAGGLTAEEFARDYMDARAELVAGRVVEMSPVGGTHGRVARKLVVQLDRYLSAHPECGELLVETGFILSRDPDVVYGPDVSVLAPGTPLPGEGFVPGAPALAIEVLSPSDTWRSVIAKATHYLAAGSGVVWIVDPGKGVVTVLLPDAPPEVLRRGDTIEGSPVLPGLALAVADIL